MPEKQNGGNRDEVPLERIIPSNMYSMEALIDVLIEKGLVTKEKVLKRIEEVVDRFERGMFPGWIRESNPAHRQDPRNAGSARSGNGIPDYCMAYLATLQGRS